MTSYATSYTTLTLYALLLELTRRFILTLLKAYTGPLSKIPGPWWGRVSRLPWAVEMMRGNHMNSGGDLTKEYGGLVRVAPDTILISDKEGIHKVLVEDDLLKAPYFDNLRLHPGNAMLVTERDRANHKHTRRLLSTGFSVSYLNGLEPIMQECLQEFENVLDERCASTPHQRTIIDMQAIISNLTFDVMSATSLGGSSHLVTSPNAATKKTFMAILIRATIFSQFPFLRYLPFVEGPISGKVNGMLNGIIERREGEMDEGKGVRDGGKGKKDILQIIIDANREDPEHFPEVRMRDEITMFMVAGSETTSAATTGILLLLVNNPDKLANLVQEIDATFPERDDDVTFEKLQALEYLNAVIWEGLRLKSVAASLQRYTTSKTLLAGYEIPAGTTIQPYPISTMHDPTIWPDAEAFIPERWLAEYKGAVAERKNILAFSAGSRNCIGWQFAMREMRLILARLVHRYEISLVEGQNHERRFHSTPWLVQGFYNVGVKLRK